MNKHHQFIVGVLLLATSLSAQTKPADQAKIDFYLDRARAEIAGWPGADVEHFSPIPSMHDVGALLMYARGNEQDRQAVKRLLDIPMKFSDKMKPENRELATQNMRITLRAALGEREALMDDIQRMVNAEKPIAPGWASWAMLYWGLIGDKERCVAGVRGSNAELIASFLYEARKGEIAQAILEDGAGPSSEQRPARRNRRDLEIAYARGGLPTAFVEIERYDRVQDRIEALQSLALFLAQSDRQADGRALLARALPEWDRLPNPHFAPRDSADELFDAGYTDYAQKAFDHGRSQRQKAESADDWWYWSDVARKAAVLGRRELVVEAERELQKRVDQPDMERPENNIDAGYALAAAQVLIGKRERAMRTFAQTRKAAPEDDLDLSESFYRIGDALRRMGDFDAAMKLATDHFQLDEPDDLDHELRKAVEHLIRAKRFDDAWKECNKYVRLWNLQQQGRLRIVLELIRTGQEKRALQLIESLNSPTARAALYLLIARDLAGTRMLGTARISYMGS